jgi:hypothetical protein
VTSELWPEDETIGPIDPFADLFAPPVAYEPARDAFGIVEEVYHTAAIRVLSVGAVELDGQSMCGLTFLEQCAPDEWARLQRVLEAPAVPGGPVLATVVILAAQPAQRGTAAILRQLGLTPESAAQRCRAGV